MRRLKRWILILGAALLGLGGLYLLFGLLFTDFLVDIWWFQYLGYGFYFWQKLLYRYLVFVSFTLLFFLVFFLNFWVATRFLGRVSLAEIKPKSWGPLRYTRLLEKFRQRSLKFYIPSSLLLALLVSYPLYHRWEDTLLFLFAPAAGLQDPVYGKDVSYYLFSLPIYLLLLRELLLSVVFLFLGLSFLYWRESRILFDQDLHLPRGARVHLSVLACIGFLMGAWAFILQRHTLLYSTSHMPLFFGPGFTEMWVVVPLIWLSIVFLLGLAVSLILYIHTRRGLKVLLAFAALFFLALGARYSPFLPGLVQKYIVAPNEIAREKTFIRHNIQATLAAYDLAEVETRDYPIREVPWDLRGAKVQETLRNIPVWDKEALLEVFRELQELRTYYDFNTVTVDRYTVSDVYQQVFLAPRELDLEKLPAGARNWLNERLKYTHGIGVVMIPAAQRGEDPMTWYIRGIPPRSDYGFKIEQPAVYYGLGKLRPVITPNDSREIGYPEDSLNVMVDYAGRGGVPVSSLFRKLIFALYFKEKDIFFTTQTNPRSRIQFRRNIVERIKTLTPFFILDRDPYLVVTPKRLYWIQDAYTVSNRYPYSQAYGKEINYIRNSVKIVVDAYDGTVDYYLADPRDPIARAYGRIYPGLLKSLDLMPADLKKHIRYPRDMFDVQMAIYSKYHQTDPEVFYKQEDIWEFSTLPHEGRMIRMDPRYLTLNILDKEKDEFILLCPMNPKARTNLRALCVVGCDGPNYGKIVVFRFPKGVLVHGPQQVEAFINQDTVLSQQFTLWNQMGSHVERGKMIILPIAETIVYVQPVYLKASVGSTIPQLKRLILSKGELVVMEPTLERGLEVLNARIRSSSEHRFPTKSPRVGAEEDKEEKP
ncbi:MAG: UPF0182 family protein [Deltaproteobacteria bacterium]|nr:UPF0182 family protein [Deltaproteobacteria bacterium]